MELILFGYVELKSESIVSTQVVILHSSGFEEAEFCVELKCSLVDALCFQDNFVHVVLYSFVEFVKQFLANFKSTIFFKHNQHCDICFTRIGGVVVANDTSNKFILIVCHDCELGPVGKKVVIGVDRIGFSELFSENVNDPVELLLSRKSL